MYVFSRVRKVVRGKFRAKWYLPRTYDYKLFLGFGRKAGVKSEIDYIIVPESIIKKATGQDVTAGLRKIDKEINNCQREIREFMRAGKTKKDLYALRKRVIELEKKKKQIDPAQKMIGRSVRLVIQS